MICIETLADFRIEMTIYEKKTIEITKEIDEIYLEVEKDTIGFKFE